MNNNNNSNHSVNVIEQFLKNLSPLPGTVRTNMAQIRKLDAECQSSSKEAQNTIKHLFNSWKSKGRDNKKKNYESIEKLFSKMSQLSDEKIKIAEQTYELVDKYIVKLDRDTEKFNIYAKRKMGENSSLHKVSFEPNKSGNKKRRFDSTSSTTEGKRSMKKNKMTLSVMESEEPATSSVFLGPISGDIAHLSDVPVDPNEPTYCYCKQVSFGQMVMCDNKNCPIEWYSLRFDPIFFNTKYILVISGFIFNVLDWHLSHEGNGFVISVQKPRKGSRDRMKPKKNHALLNDLSKIQKNTTLKIN